MTINAIKIIAKKIFVNIFMLIIILALVIAITGIPTNFDIISSNGINTPNMSMTDIIQSIKDNFKVFFSGEILNITIQGESIIQLLAKTAKRSSIILLFGALLAVIIGVPKGIIDSRKKNRSSTIKLLQSLIPLSVPDIFTIGIVQILAIHLFKNQVSILGLGPIQAFGDASLKNVIYPIVSISILPAAFISRITANIIEDSFEKPYILAARGKGCSRFQIIKNHMIKSIFYGVLSGFPTVISILFSSLVIVEKIFHFRGIGFYLIFFYTTPLIPPYDAGVSFTFFIVILALFYYFIFMIFNVLKEILLPEIKSH